MIEQWLQTYHPEMSYGTGPLAFIYEEVLRQANMMSFNDCFWILSWVTAALIPLTLFLRKTDNDGNTP